MKVLVVSNCATIAYASGLRALFPDWDVKGADLVAATKFVEERNPAFQGNRVKKSVTNRI
ncbi:MAG TPA: hypothetical protein VME69_09670 [Methylocella sp.]|nr:hypothetical protein [Methylocella sp.]